MQDLVIEAFGIIRRRGDGLKNWSNMAYVKLEWPSSPLDYLCKILSALFIVCYIVNYIIKLSYLLILYYFITGRGEQKTFYEHDMKKLKARHVFGNIGKTF